MSEESYKSIGTTQPVLIPKGDGTPVRIGENYFAIQVRSAQAAFLGHVWERVRRLVIVSSVSLNHPLLGAQPVEALHRSREVDKGRAEQLGLSLNLTNWVPATMDRVSVSFEFILDKQNKLVQLADMINKDGLLMALSFTPAGIAAASVVAGVSRKLVNTFLAADERKPILRFDGDFNLASNDLREGYYAILGTRDDANPLPRPVPKLSVQDDDLLADGMPITQWSYVLLEVHRLDARGRESGIGQPWHKKLIDAENIAQDVENEESISDEERKGRFQVCQSLLKEMRTLLNADPSYLSKEAQSIYQAAFMNCREQIFRPISERMRYGERIAAAVGKEIDVPDDLQAIMHELSQLKQPSDMPHRSQLCQRALGKVEQNAQPQLWAALQVQLGISLAQNPLGDRAENNEQAIEHYHQALEVITRQAMPVEWAETMMNLAVAYQNRIRGDRAENIELAIEHYKQALELRTRQAMPVEWAATMMNLANAYADRIRGDRTENLELAREAEQQALDESLMAIDEGTRELLGVADEQGLNDAVSTYAEQVARSRQIMQEVGIQ